MWRFYHVLTIHDSILYLNVEENDEQIQFNALIKISNLF
jgi:hypothetical protein